MKLFLVRHGETDWNKLGRFQGREDVPLNDRGLAQAGQTAQAMAGCQPTAIYSSPLARTMRAAEEIARLGGPPVVPVPGLEEWDLGELEGVTGAEMRERWPELFATWRENPGQVAMPGGESLAQLQERAWQAILKLVQAHDDNDVLVVVSHNFTIRAIIAHILGLPLANFHRMSLGLASISLVESDHRGWRLVSYNSTCHLSPEAQ